MGSCSSIHARNLAEAKRKGKSPHRYSPQRLPCLVSPFNEDASGSLFHRNETGNRDEASTKKKAHSKKTHANSSVNLVS